MRTECVSVSVGRNRYRVAVVSKVGRSSLERSVLRDPMAGYKNAQFIFHGYKWR
jgi:hypothetical protein